MSDEVVSEFPEAVGGEHCARQLLEFVGVNGRNGVDQVIETMRATGMDMSSKYMETSTGGLAVTVNVVEC